MKPDQFVGFDPEGLRITLPAGYQRQRPGYGLATTFGLKGNFEITAGYEILQEDRKVENPDLYTGLNLEVIPQRPEGNDPEQFVKPSQNRASLARALWIRQRTLFLATATQWDGSAAKEEFTRKEFPTTAKAGRLRLTPPGRCFPSWSPKAPTGSSSS